MTKKRGGWLPWAITGIVLSLAAIAAIIFVFFGNIFHQNPGEIIYNDVSSDIQTLISTALDNSQTNLKSDLTVSSERTTAKTTDGLLYNIYLPVTDFYNSVSSVDLETAKSGDLVAFSELNNTVKLLAIDDRYYLDTLDSGAFFEYIRLSGDEADVAKVTEILQPLLPEFPTKDTLLSLVQTGVTALSRGMNGKLKQVGDATYFSAKIKDFFNQFDLVHTSNEASFDSAAPSNNGTTVICALPGMIDTITDAGIDIIELTGNHNQDCGDESALATLTQYANLGIKTFGGGATADEAAKPLQISEKGNNITLLGYNLSTGGYTLDDTPGANFYTPEKAQADITAAKARGDFIIVDVQYYECNNYDSTVENTACDYANSAAGDQIGLFRELIDMGADVVVGTAAHQPQTYELYGNGVIYYGLGNLFFDQYWWPGTTRSLMLIHYFYQGKLLQTRIVPTVYDHNFQTEIMDAETAAWFIERLNQARPE